MKNVYHAIFYSHIIYGISAWGSAYETHLNSLQILQNRVVRLIAQRDCFPLTPGPLQSATPLYRDLGFLKIKDIFKHSLCIFVHKCLYLP